ncbi:GNAT family N-acetyltransferase [Pedobacter petrophilus]|uniref:GNAT family N-acetyltransferase n=1 Tax=Pedobacter petrophilus TaxID=1908241 RepID=A0A7K0G2F3_9SPHI|nr:GNAT family N-acetyltransferase [Pedobacter petrophilus]MRX77449.1 GNAT family N-acetyltransferase [Pedobacter petrophilus]
MTDLKLIRTDSDDVDFKQLIILLDQDLAIRDGDEHAFYSQFNKVDAIKEVIVAYINETPAGCGAIKKFSDDTVEVKRMFVHSDYRKKGTAARIVGELENWAAELGFSQCVLETGKKQPEAIALYQKCGYQITPNYGQYIGVENSICMAKALNA